MNVSSAKFSPLLTIVGASLLMSCASGPQPPELPAPLRAPKIVEPYDGQQLAGRQEERSRDRFQTTPQPPLAESAAAVKSGEPSMGLRGEPVSVSLEGLPLPAFINEVFGNQLKLSYQISADLQERTDLVTLRINEPVKPDDLFLTARQVLKNYGVAVEKQGDVFLFALARGEVASEPPLLISGDALPNVPVSHRPIFQMIPLRVAANQEVVGWLKQAFEGQSKLSIQQDGYRNAIWLRGNVDLVQQAAEVVRMLDQPLMRGRNSFRIEPLFTPPDRLANRLVEVLRNEGYSAAVRDNASIVFLPVPEIGSLLVFVQDSKVTSHIKSWVEQFDRPVVQADNKGIFHYALRNALADSVAQVINSVIDMSFGAADAAAEAAAAPSSTGRAVSNAASPSRASRSRSSGRMVVDTTRNALLFQGSADEWAQILPVIRRMDVPAKQVLVEVLVAEVTLTDDFKFGVEWAINNATLGDRLFTFDKDQNGQNGDVLNVGKGLTIGSGGLTYYPINSSGQTRAVLNLFAQNSQVSILQAPRIMVKSGEQATINVGNEIPVLSSRSSVPGQQVEGNSALIQQFEYRRTGVQLTVAPVVFEGGRVDLKVTQDVSSALPTSAEGGNPTILSRNLNTVLSVNDGGSVLLGGLITNGGSVGETKVPVLGDLPLIGQLFRSESKGNSRTELMVLIVPYVLDDNGQAEAITRAFQNSLKLHEPSGQATSDQAEMKGK